MTSNILLMLCVFSLCTVSTLCIEEISCSTKAKDIKDSITNVLCPSGCLKNAGVVWGTDVYTDDSSICRAAIHAGVTTNKGGEVTIKFIEGPDNYTASTRNGITTISYKKWPRAFIFPTPSNCPIPKPRAVKASCSTAGKEIKESTAIVLCPSGCLANGNKVWGSDKYTDDSSICRAAIHTGIITDDGGEVTISIIEGLDNYTPSTRNGITTTSYGKWPRAFIFPTASNCPTHTSTVEVSCSTTGKSIKESNAKVRCPSGCLNSEISVWGTNIYTDDSGICKAAIHAGVMTDYGGEVTLLKIEGQDNYIASTRNGVTTISYNKWPGAFKFSASNCPTVKASCTTAGKEIKESTATVLCPSGCLANGNKVWGTHKYTDDSSICRAAIHTGIITDDGGEVTISMIAGQDNYTPSTRNGITTTSYGKWPRAFIFPTASNCPTYTSTVEISCSTIGKDIKEPNANVRCPSGCFNSEISVWGTYIYTDDSGICKAAIHTGVMTDYGGEVTLTKIEGLDNYTASTRNGITTISYNKWPGAFKFSASNCPTVKASCSTSAKEIKETTATVRCPSGCLNDGKEAWGTDIYTDDSPICRAAIHAGVINDNGGEVAIKITEGQDNYTPSTRNGITTSSFKKWPRAFIFRTASNCPIPKPRAVQVSCSEPAKEIKETTAIVQCPSGCLNNGKEVWGTNNYTDDSSICRAAIHAGEITDNGGEVTIKFTEGQDKYVASTRNGVTTSSFGKWSRTFIFLPE